MEHLVGRTISLHIFLEDKGNDVFSLITKKIFQNFDRRDAKGMTEAINLKSIIGISSNVVNIFA
jgi:hypothetical protein